MDEEKAKEKAEMRVREVWAEMEVTLTRQSLQASQAEIFQNKQSVNVFQHR